MCYLSWAVVKGNVISDGIGEEGCCPRRRVSSRYGTVHALGGEFDAGNRSAFAGDRHSAFHLLRKRAHDPHAECVPAHRVKTFRQTGSIVAHLEGITSGL